MTQAAYQPSMLDLAHGDADLGRSPAGSAATSSAAAPGSTTCPAGSSAPTWSWRPCSTTWTGAPSAAQMYDRVVDVPRLLRWYGGDDELPHPLLDRGPAALTEHYARRAGRALRHRRHVPLPRRPRQRRLARRHHRPRRTRHHGRDRLVRRPATAAAAPRGGGASRALPARPRRPGRHGRLLPAHLGTRHPQDRPPRRPARQRPVPPHHVA